MNPYLIGGVILALLASHTSVYFKGRFDERASLQSERAINAERQRDIANEPPASLDAVIEWLRGG